MERFLAPGAKLRPKAEAAVKRPVGRPRKRNAEDAEPVQPEQPDANAEQAEQPDANAEQADAEANN